MLGAFFAKYKVLVYVVAVTALVGSLYSYDRWRYRAGYEAGHQTAEVEYRRASDKAVEEATKDLKERLEASVKRQKEQQELVGKLNKELSEDREAMRKKLHDIQNVTKDSECRNIGTPAFELFNSILAFPKTK